jgi:hypothetical protein
MSRPIPAPIGEAAVMPSQPVWRFRLAMPIGRALFRTVLGGAFARLAPERTRG